jgi:ABC-type Fe3+ transport system permease subunit
MAGVAQLENDRLVTATFFVCCLAFVLGAIVTGLSWTEMSQIETALLNDNAFAEGEYSQARLWFTIGLGIAAAGFSGMLGLVFSRLGQ